jgi:hypothetical protein
MMMAYDSGHLPPRRLDEATLEAVRATLRAYLTDSSDPGALQRALLRLSTEAREKDILAEQLLVTLKEVWASLPAVRAMIDTTEQLHLLQRVVTMCIREYYDA